ncbi:hypothetical protein HK102_010174, partial [Quaeritorhiza haematococci]
DLDHATRLVRKMVTQWGMSERVGPVSFRSSSEHPFLGREMSEPRDHSEHMQQIIDEEVARILREAEEHAFRLLEEHRDELERLTEALIEKEVLTESEITQLIGKRSGHVEPEAEAAGAAAPAGGGGGRGYKSCGIGKLRNPFGLEVTGEIKNSVELGQAGIVELKRRDKGETAGAQRDGGLRTEA